MISSKVTAQGVSVKTEHLGCLDSRPYSTTDLYIESTSPNNNTLTTITFEAHTKIYVFWESFTSAECFEVLYIPETKLLFIGCGCLSARINLNSSEIVGVANVCLFWEFSIHNNFVLECGELDCFLYDLYGNLVSKTVVDPPYDMEICEDGIKFKSIVVGTTWLRFSENG